MKNKKRSNTYTVCKQTSFRACDWLFTIITLRRSCDEFVTILWSSYDFSKTGLQNVMLVGRAILMLVTYFCYRGLDPIPNVNLSPPNLNFVALTVSVWSLDKRSTMCAEQKEWLITVLNEFPAHGVVLAVAETFVVAVFEKFLVQRVGVAAPSVVQRPRVAHVALQRLTCARILFRRHYAIYTWTEWEFPLPLRVRGYSLFQPSAAWIRN